MSDINDIWDDEEDRLPYVRDEAPSRTVSEATPSSSPAPADLTPEQRGRDAAAALFDGTILTETRLATAIAATIREAIVPTRAVAPAGVPEGWKPIEDAKLGAGGLLLGNANGVYASGAMPEKWVQGFVREDGTAWDSEGYPLNATHFFEVPNLPSTSAGEA